MAMNSAQALQVCARRFCGRQRALWCRKLELLPNDGWTDDFEDYTPEAKEIYPRSNVLRAILAEVERLDPDHLDDFETTRTCLITAGHKAQDEMTTGAHDLIEINAMRSERERYCGYVESVGMKELADVEPLPYRRVLRAEETKAIRDQVFAVWRIAGTDWFPDEEGLPGTSTFHARYFDEANRRSSIVDELEGRGIRRIWELREDGPEYEIATTAWEPYYNGAEGVWTSEAMDWVLYAAAGQSVTIGGWLLGAIQTLWPDSDSDPRSNS